MRNKHFVYAYDSEPAIDRTTGFPRFDHSALTSAPTPWAASGHSTFEEPSHSVEHIQARRARRENRYVIMTALLAVSAVSAAVVSVLH